MEPGESERSYPQGKRSHTSGGPGSRRFAALGVALVLGTIPLAAGANDGEESRTGPRVRVTQASSRERTVGRLLEQTDEVLVLEKGSAGGGDLVRIPRSDVAHSEVSVRRGRKRMGAAIGALAGALVAVVVIASDDSGCSSGGYAPCFSQGEATAMAGALTVPAGALIGALLAPGEKWKEDSLSRFAVGLGPAPGGGLAARVALSF
jgi:hypothetical protein